MTDDDERYWRKRAILAQSMAVRASCSEARAAHAQMAAMYQDRAGNCRGASIGQASIAIDSALRAALRGVDGHALKQRALPESD